MNRNWLLVFAVLVQWNPSLLLASTDVAIREAYADQPGAGKVAITGLKEVAIEGHGSDAYRANSQPVLVRQVPVRSGSLVGDPGFETGSPNAVWTEASTNFGTPLCTEATCGLGGGTGANSGAWWAWFGGIGAFEEGSVSQSITVSDTTDLTLEFRLETAACSGDSADFLEVLVDGVQVFLVQGDDPNCNVVGYRTVTVDLSGIVVSNTFELEFHSIVQGADLSVTNFFVDDIDIVRPPKDPCLTITGVCPGEITITITEATPGALIALLFSLFGGGQDIVPGGPCAGVLTDLQNLGLLTLLKADGSGQASITRTVSARFCGALLQALDSSTCDLSGVDFVP